MPYPLGVTPQVPSLPSPEQPLIYFLSLDLPMWTLCGMEPCTLSFWELVLFTWHRVFKFFHAVTRTRTPFLSMAEWCSVLWLCHIPFAHSSADALSLYHPYIKQVTPFCMCLCQGWQKPPVDAGVRAETRDRGGRSAGWCLRL